MTTDTTEPAKTLVHVPSGECVALDAEPFDLARFVETIGEMRAELSDAENVILAELVTRLDRRGEWTLRVGDAEAGVQYEIKAPSPAVGTTKIDVAPLRDRLREMVAAGTIDVELARAVVKRKVTIVAHVDVDADLSALVDKLPGLTAIAGVGVHDVKVDYGEASAAAGIGRLRKAGHGDVVDAVTVDVPAPARRAKVTAKRKGD